MENRDLSFRAWDGEIMLYYEPQTTEEYEPEWVNFFFKKCKVMQFTGLHDKNINPIWEGDIIRVDKIYPYTEKICVMEWAGWKVDVNWMKNKAGWNLRKVSKGTMQIWTDSTIEIIGNIYQNPELCEGN